MNIQNNHSADATTVEEGLARVEAQSAQEFTSDDATALAMQNTLMTPRTKALYAFGESPSRDLDIINKAIGTRLTSGGGTTSESSSDASAGKRKRRAPMLSIDMDDQGPKHKHLRGVIDRRSG